LDFPQYEPELQAEIDKLLAKRNGTGRQYVISELQCREICSALFVKANPHTSKPPKYSGQNRQQLIGTYADNWRSLKAVENGAHLESGAGGTSLRGNLRMNAERRMRIFTAIIHPDHRPALARMELQATREELDNKSTGAGKEIFVVATRAFNDPSWTGKILTEGPYGFDIDKPARDGDQITQEQCHDAYKTIRKEYSSFETDLRTSGQSMKAEDFIYASNGKHGQEQQYVYDCLSKFGELKGYVSSDIGEGGFGGPGSTGLFTSPPPAYGASLGKRPRSSTPTHDLTGDQDEDQERLRARHERNMDLARAFAVGGEPSASVESVVDRASAAHLRQTKALELDDRLNAKIEATEKQLASTDPNSVQATWLQGRLHQLYEQSTRALMAMSVSSEDRG
jgi:hypothetical protein